VLQLSLNVISVDNFDVFLTTVILVVKSYQLPGSRIRSLIPPFHIIQHVISEPGKARAL